MRCLLLTIAFGVLAWGQWNDPIAVVLANGTKCPMTIVRDEPGARIVEPRGQRRGCPRSASRITHTSSRWGRTRSVLRHITRPVLGAAVGVPATAVMTTLGLIEGTRSSAWRWV